MKKKTEVEILKAMVAATGKTQEIVAQEIGIRRETLSGLLSGKLFAGRNIADKLFLWSGGRVGKIPNESIMNHRK